MKKTKLLLAALISMFAFTCGVKAIEVNTEEEFISAMNSGEDIKLTENIEVNSSLIDEINIANLILLVKNPMELDETKIYFIKKKLYDYTTNSIEEFKNSYSNKTM